MVTWKSLGIVVLAIIALAVLGFIFLSAFACGMSDSGHC